MKRSLKSCMPNVLNYILSRKMLKTLWKKYGLNPFDSLLKKAANAGRRRFLICWNRGLGDIPLGLYALTFRIRQYIPDAEVTFATRPDLADGFKMLENVSVLIDPEWKRGAPFDIQATLAKSGLSSSDFDVILESPDPTRWLMWQIGKLIPKLSWNPEWDALHERFSLDPSKDYIGVHVQTETQYAYEKNWPTAHWKEFFQATSAKGMNILLFGFAQNPVFEGENIIDLRGKTSLFEMLSLIKNRCRYLLVPDSGVLSITYYIDASFDIDIVSLWADPRQGILRQKVPSPNPLLRHTPLIAKDKDLRTIDVQTVVHSLFQEALC
jgi:ADP-heptose:LPS heptosyltransferase